MHSSPRIVPIKGKGLAPAGYSPKLTYHQGHLLTSVEVYTIFWGTGWQQAPQNGLIQPLNDFFDFILTSSLIDLLAEYSVPGQTIGHGKRVGTNTITTSDPGTIQPGGGRVVTDAQIQQALQNWINNNTIPQPNNNTLFFVYFPPNVTVSDGGGSCSSYCGYHSDINGTIFYAVMPYIDCTGCTSGQNLPFDSLTEVSSHELCEAITDPAPTTGWNDDSLPDGEIGDLCNFQATQLGAYNVQTQWSNLANACRSAPQYRKVVGHRTMAPSADGRLEVFAVGNDGALWHLWQTAANNGWSAWYSHGSAGGGFTGPLAIAPNADGRLEVFVRGNDSALWQLWQTAPSNGWSAWYSEGTAGVGLVVSL